MKRYLFTAIIVLMASLISAQIRIDTPAQDAPSDGATDQMPNVYLNWDAVINAQSYQVQMSEDADFTNIVLDETVDLTAYQTSHLYFNFEYFWRVRAIDMNGNNSAWSPIWSFTTFSQIVLSRPNNGTDGIEPDVVLKWRDRIGVNLLTGIEHFQLQIDTAASFDSPLFAQFQTAGDVYERQMAFLRFGTTYKWRVRATHATDESDWSDVRDFTVLDMIDLKKPNNGTTGNDLNVELRWDDLSGIERFDFQIDDNENFTSPAQYTVSDYRTPAPDLEYGNTYYWRVRGRHEMDTSSWSEAWSFATADAVTLTSPANGQDSVSVKPRLNFEPILGSTEYEIAFGKNEDFSNATVDYMPASDTIVPSYIVLTTLDEGTVYYWHVRAINGNDTSSYSEAWSFETIGAIGIDEYFKQAQVNLYPNPAKDQISVQLHLDRAAIVEFSLIDLTGQTVINRNLTLAPGSSRTSIALNNIANGIYMVKLTKGQQVYTNKLIINR